MDFLNPCLMHFSQATCLGYLFVCRLAEYLTGKVPHRPLQTSVPANVYCLLIRTLAQEAVPSNRAKACEPLCGGKLSLLARPLLWVILSLPYSSGAEVGAKP